MQARIFRFFIGVGAGLFLLAHRVNASGEPLPVAANGGGYLGMSLPAEFRAFSDLSPWNTPIQNPADEDPSSKLMVGNLSQKAKKLHGAFFRWTVPVHVIDSTKCPRVRVRSLKGRKNHDIDPDGDGYVEDVPIPSGIWPDPTPDGLMVLVDPQARKSWEFSRFGQDTNGQCSASGITIWDLDGPGFRLPFEGAYWWTYGSNGAGTPLIAGLIRPEEIAAGEIRHALLCATPINRKTSRPGGKQEVCPPASKTDGQGIGLEFIPEGARLQLDPALDLDRLDLSPAVKIVARAMQRYGMYVTDGARDFKVYFQNLGPDGGKWQQWKGFDDLTKIPIESFRVLKCDIVVKK
jgi:hypothetical protein